MKDKGDEFDKTLTKSMIVEVVEGFEAVSSDRERDSNEEGGEEEDDGREAE